MAVYSRIFSAIIISNLPIVPLFLRCIGRIPVFLAIFLMFGSEDGLIEISLLSATGTLKNSLFNLPEDIMYSG